MNATGKMLDILFKPQDVSIQFINTIICKSLISKIAGPLWGESAGDFYKKSCH